MKEATVPSMPTKIPTSGKSGQKWGTRTESYEI